MTRLNRMINPRVLLQVLVLILVTPTFAVAGSLPTPRISGPTQVPGGWHATLHVSYTPIHESYQDVRGFVYWVQYWFCEPGADAPPGNLNTQYCRRTETYFNFQSPYTGSWLLPVPMSAVVIGPEVPGSTTPIDGTWYVRVELFWTHKDGTHQQSSWSSWHRVAVGMSAKGAVKPPIVQAPKQNQLFINQGVTIEVNRSPVMRHTDYSLWEYAFEWKRADYHTAANTAYAKRIYLKKYPNSSSSYFPPVGGLSSELQPWLSLVRPRWILEGPGTASAHLNFSFLRSKHMDSSYLYQFRVREHRRGSKSYGPWSPWRGFIVQERIGSPTLYHYNHGAGALLHGVHVLPRGTRGTIHGTPHGKPTVGLRHGIRQRGIRKKLAPAAPVRRLAPTAPVHRLTPTAPVHRLTPAAPVRRLTPAAPVRRLNLPAQLRLNR
jgi:hypothetical protein